MTRTILLEDCREKSLIDIATPICYGRHPPSRFQRNLRKAKQEALDHRPSVAGAKEQASMAARKSFASTDEALVPSGFPHWYHRRYVPELESAGAKFFERNASADPRQNHPVHY